MPTLFSTHTHTYLHRYPLLTAERRVGASDEEELGAPRVLQPHIHLLQELELAVLMGSVGVDGGVGGGDVGYVGVGTHHCTRGPSTVVLAFALPAIPFPVGVPGGAGDTQEGTLRVDGLGEVLVGADVVAPDEAPDAWTK